eukprot:3913754-Prymnesium_polylepis.3
MSDSALLSTCSPCRERCTCEGCALFSMCAACQRAPVTPPRDAMKRNTSLAHTPRCKLCVSLAARHTLYRRPNQSFDEYAQHPANAFDAFAPGCGPGDYSCSGYSEQLVEQDWFYDLADLNQ